VVCRESLPHQVIRLDREYVVTEADQLSGHDAGARAEIGDLPRGWVGGASATRIASTG
jgi:hypothetical protein